MKQLHESGEMYLETILLLSKEKSQVRSIDISEEMGFSKPSVSRAIGILKNEKYIKVDNAGHIELTDLGRKTAEKIYDRHVTLTAYLKKLGVDDETADEDACRIEHVISDKASLE
jgi:DtxR family Mn-dependent transcriptional regulator